jgi:prepilin-type N-terminal cleavage/methylation domain-containing protein
MLVRGPTLTPAVEEYFVVSVNTAVANRKKQGGFTLVELAIVIVIIGVLASFGVPRFRDAVERSKAGEALNYLATIRAAEERYQARMGTYTANLADLDVTFPTPKYFAVGTIAAGDSGDIEDSWTLTLTRAGASAGYGAYTVVFTQEGYDAVNSTIEALPQINPIGSSAPAV